MHLDILLETSDYLIINKPAGLIVHPSAALRTSLEGNGAEPTLVDILLKERPDIAGIGEPMIVDGKSIDRPGIVHRLDRDTSGVMIIAKTQTFFEYIKSQFKDRLVQKEYHTFVWGYFKESSGIVNVPIGRNKNDFRLWHAAKEVDKGVRGETREAVTKWEVQHSFADEQGELFSFMKLFPKTGRTHQLRVHMKYLQRPIVSDPLYAGHKQQALGFARTALHARNISFIDQNGDTVSIEAPYPDDFAKAIARYIYSTIALVP